MKSLKLGLAIAMASFLTTTVASLPQRGELEMLKERARAQGGKVTVMIDAQLPIAPLPLLASGAELIVQGRISHAEARYSEDERGSGVRTYFTVTPSRTFKNIIAAGTRQTPGPTMPVVFVQSGGTVRVDGLEISYVTNLQPDPPLQVNEEIIAFLIRKPNTDVYWLHHGAYGLLRVREGKVVAPNKRVARGRPLDQDGLHQVQQRIEELVKPKR